MGMDRFLDPRSRGQGAEYVVRAGAGKTEEVVPAEGLEPPTPRSEVWWIDKSDDFELA